MSKDDKHRVIGKIVAIATDRFTVELLGGIENFNISGYDDIHYFAQVNSYVVLPYQNYYIIAEIVGVRERDAGFTNTNPIEQILNKARSIKYLEIVPIGTIKNKTNFNFGVSVYPPLYSDVLYIKQTELNCIFSVENSETKINDDYQTDEYKIYGDNTRLNSLSIGMSTIFENYDIKVDIDKFFGSHSAILGNTGSGKSCTISSMIQSLASKMSFSFIGGTFIIFDVNGEYQQAFSKINNVNPEIEVTNITLADVPDNDPVYNKFRLPHWFLNIDEWGLLLQASEKTQFPILRNALGLTSLFKEDDNLNDVKNHVLATCITEILRDETSSPSKKDRIKSILQKFHTSDINLLKEFSYPDERGTMRTSFNNGIREVQCTIENCLFIHYGELKGLAQLFYYLEQKDSDGNSVFLSDNFKLPTYRSNVKFDFDILDDALDLAILYEEAHGNKQIRDYCSSMLTRFKSLKERDDYSFLRDKADENFKKYRNGLLGIIRLKKGDTSNYYKKSQILIIDLSSVEDEIVEVISCVLARIAYEALKNLEPRNTFPINLVLEEAHRYISIDQQRAFLKANRIFEIIAKEGRKFGMFLMVSSQRPSELSKTVLSQCGNFIVHRIQNPEDLSHIRQMTPHISETILKRLPSIPTQHALVFGQAVNLPALFKVKTSDPLPKSDNNRISRNWFKERDSVLNIIINQ